MKAIFLRERGGPALFRYEDVPTPQPAAGEVLVRVHAAAVTPTELEWVPTWTTPTGSARPFPIIPGHELSGVVHALGSGVSDLAPGDAVIGLNDWFGNGTQAEYCLARAVDLARKPSSLDHALAATVPISALTACQGLIVRGRVAAGERVLVHGAAGGVGLFAVQMAHRLGAHVIATASAHNLDFVRELGADQVIDYRTQRFEDAANGADVVFDTVGGDTLARSWGILRGGGRIVTIAASSEHTSEARVKEAFFIVEPSREQLEQVAASIDAGDLRTVAGAVFPLAQARQAYEHKPKRGKVVLRVAD